MSKITPIYKHSGIIRSIRIGLDYKDAMVFTVGNTMKAGDKTYKITRITEDTHDDVVFGIQRHNIFGESDDKIEKLRRSFHGMPCCVEYENT